LDLHVLSTPPAFVLSQDQTLQENLQAPRTRSSRNAGLNKDRVRNQLIVICSLAAAHENCSSTRAIARMSHSIVKQQLAPPTFEGTLKITGNEARARGNPLRCSANQRNSRAP